MSDVSRKRGKNKRVEQAVPEEVLAEGSGPNEVVDADAQALADAASDALGPPADVEVKAEPKKAKKSKGKAAKASARGGDDTASTDKANPAGDDADADESDDDTDAGLIAADADPDAADADSDAADAADAADALSRDCSGRAARLSSDPSTASRRSAAPPFGERPPGRGWSGRRKGIIETASAIRAHGCPGRTDGVLGRAAVSRQSPSVVQEAGVTS